MDITIPTMNSTSQSKQKREKKTKKTKKKQLEALYRKKALISPNPIKFLSLIRSCKHTGGTQRARTH